MHWIEVLILSRSPYYLKQSIDSTSSLSHVKWHILLKYKKKNASKIHTGPLKVLNYKKHSWTNKTKLLESHYQISNQIANQNKVILAYKKVYWPMKQNKEPRNKFMGNRSLTSVQDTHGCLIAVKCISKSVMWFLYLYLVCSKMLRLFGIFYSQYGF